MEILILYNLIVSLIYLVYLLNDDLFCTKIAVIFFDYG